MTKSIVNALANYAFLTKDTNIEISNQKPEEYFPVYLDKCPGAMETHWIPMDTDLWKIENYEAFLAQRRILLANAANVILDSLYNGQLEEAPINNFADRHYSISDNDGNEIEQLCSWLNSCGLNEGSINHELLDDDGNVIVIIDLAWPQGIQQGLSEPIALLLNEDADTQAIVSRKGYRYYTSISEIKEYIEASYLS